MRKKLDNLVEKIKEKMKKHIKNNDVTWTKEILLKLIYIEKRNMARQKSVKKSGNWGRTILTCSQKSSTIIVIPKHDITVNDQHPKLPKNITTGKYYIKAKYEMCADEKCKVVLKSSN